MDDVRSLLVVVRQNRPIVNVAFYDRASTPQQQFNSARSLACEQAIEFARENKLSFVASGDKRNKGICFLDVCSGVHVYARPEFYRMLNDDRIDTIIGVRSDRLYRGKLAGDMLEEIVDWFGKNLAYISDTETQALLMAFVRDMNYAQQLRR